MPVAKPFRIIPCTEWGARPPKQPISAAGKFDKAVFHHTAGHHPELPPLEPAETYEEARAYARAIQAAHMSPPRNWLDSGHNFFVARSGHIFEGRHRSLELLEKGRAPVSAHCPGQNDQPGVELEHLGSEPLSVIQREAAVWLFAMICREGGFEADRIRPHREFIATACPSEALMAALPAFRASINAALKPVPDVWQPGDPVWQDLPGPQPKPDPWFWDALEELERRKRILAELSPAR